MVSNLAISQLQKYYQAEINLEITLQESVRYLRGLVMVWKRPSREAVDETLNPFQSPDQSTQNHLAATGTLLWSPTVIMLRCVAF